MKMASYAAEHDFSDKNDADEVEPLHEDRLSREQNENFDEEENCDSEFAKV